jgi:lambda family phage portal protein
MNLIDRMVEVISPTAALKRVYARATLADVHKRMDRIAKRGFDAGKTGNRGSGWQVGGGTINAELTKSLSIIRNRSRDLVANNGYIKRAIKILVGNIIGTGIVPKFDDAEVAKLWNRWARKDCDANGLMGFSGLQAQIVRAMWESGEVLVRFRVRRVEDGLSVPLQLQVLESDHLDTLKTGETTNGFMLAGVQFNALGQRVGYWLFDRHPGEVGALAKTMTSRFVPASEILHLFDPTGRPGQVRGLPEFAVSIWRARDLDDYKEAHSIRKKIEACFAAFVTSSDNQFSAGVTGKDDKNQRVDDLSPGMIEYLRPGETIEFSNPTASDGYEESCRVELRDIAAGTGVTYEQLTGDYSQVNFTSGRMGKMEFKTMIEQFQWLVFIPMFCDAVAERFATVAYLAGEINSPRIMPTSWTAPRIALLDPLREAQAYQVMREIAAMSRQEIIRELGFDPDEVDKEIAEDNHPIAAPTKEQAASRQQTRKELLKEA